MSQQNLANFRLLKNLLSQLRTFGLNPNDWCIERRSFQRNGVQLYHRDDQDFRILTHVTRSVCGQIKIHHLQLISI